MKHPIACLITIFSSLGLQSLKNILYWNSNRVLISALWNGGNRKQILSTWHLMKWPSPQRITNAKEMLVRLLGVPLENAQRKLGMIPRHLVRLEWPRSKFSDVTNADSSICIMCCASAYLLYLMGYTMFADKSGTRVSISYIPLFENLCRISSYALGAAVLVYLYRQLGYA